MRRRTFIAGGSAKSELGTEGEYKKGAANE